MTASPRCQFFIKEAVNQQMHAQAIVNFWRSNWCQLYLGSILLGFFSAGAAAMAKSLPHIAKSYGEGIRFLLYFAATANVTAIVMTVAHHYDSPWLKVCNLADHLLLFIVDGALLAIPLVTYPSLKIKDPGQSTLLRIFLHPKMIQAARYAVASLYIGAGTTKWLAFETIDFFHASGYSTAFFYFIATWEFVWGIGVLWRKSLNIALFALSIDMFGAIYTHYHNYFARGFEGPLGNSVDALRMLTLIGYIALASNWKPGALWFSDGGRIPMRA